MSIFSAAGTALGLGSGTDMGLGSQLPQQVKDETEEEKRKKRLGMSALQSPAGQALLSGPFARGY